MFVVNFLQRRSVKYLVGFLFVYEDDEEDVDIRIVKLIEE